MEKRGRFLKRGAVLLLCSVIGVPVLLDPLLESGRAGAQQAGRLRDTDCSYLKDPRSFEGVDGRHRLDLSRQTEAISQDLQQTAGQLVAAQEMPRKNYIDQHIFDRMGQAGIDSAPLCTDEEYLRRVTLDLTGRIPTAATVSAFLADTSANKRDRLVDQLIASPEFIDKWTLYFGDLFRNTAFPSNIQIFLDGREAFHRFIRNGITVNRPYNQLVTELITATGDNKTNGAANFIVLGNVPMGPAQDTMDGLAVQASSVFLGLSSMDCLLCHDGAGHLDAVNLWGAGVTRAQAYGMSAFFARTRRAFTRANSSVNYGTYTITENATGEYQLNTNSGNRQNRTPIEGRNTAAPRYLTGTTTVGSGENRRQALARLLTADPQFARATVNYLWEEMMVEGLVSPSNTFDPARLDPAAKLPAGWSVQPHNPELLEALARDFQQNGFNLRQVIGTIAKSTTYQLSSRYPGTWKLEYLPFYARRYVRRLDAEEIHDAVVQATGIPPVTTYRETGSTTNVTIFGYPILGDEGTKQREVRWAGQLPDPNEPRQRGDVRSFLDSFLRGNRDSNLRSDDSSILQALNLMNNSFVTTRIRLNDRATVGTETIRNTVYNLVSNTALTNEQLIDQLYLTTLSRRPTAAEKSKILPYFNTGTRQTVIESLQWVLLNKVDFIFNY
jgi:hypothetical protein